MKKVMGFIYGPQADGAYICVEDAERGEKPATALYALDGDEVCAECGRSLKDVAEAVNA